MQVITLPAVTAARETVIALGFFDGCHAGHRALLAETVKLAWDNRCLPAVFTFSDGAAKPGTRFLSSFEERLRLFDDAGIGAVFAAPFSSLQHLSPEMFVRNVLTGMCGAKIAVAGNDFRFGEHAAGDAERLRMLMAGENRRARILPPVGIAGVPVSSSAVRSLLENGEIEQANRLLCRCFSLSGTVEKGKRLGGKIGFPTANLQPEAWRVLPMRGVYVTETETENGVYRSVTDVGTRPTVENDAAVRAETFLCGFAGDLYGKTITVRFLHRLRDEVAFASLDELKAQLALDQQQAEDYHGNGMDETDGSL